MILEYFTPETIPEDLINELAKNDIDTNDFDYIIVYSIYNLKTEVPVDDYVNRFLQGMDKNEWHKIKVRGRCIAVGISYHG